MQSERGSILRAHHGNLCDQNYCTIFLRLNPSPLFEVDPQLHSHGPERFHTGHYTHGSLAYCPKPKIVDVESVTPITDLNGPQLEIGGKIFKKTLNVFGYYCDQHDRVLLKYDSDVSEDWPLQTIGEYNCGCVLDSPSLPIFYRKVDYYSSKDISPYIFATGSKIVLPFPPEFTHINRLPPTFTFLFFPKIFHISDRAYKIILDVTFVESDAIERSPEILYSTTKPPNPAPRCQPAYKGRKSFFPHRMLANCNPGSLALCEVGSSPLETALIPFPRLVGLPPSESEPFLEKYDLESLSTRFDYNNFPYEYDPLSKEELIEFPVAKVLRPVHNVRWDYSLTPKGTPVGRHKKQYFVLSPIFKEDGIPAGPTPFYVEASVGLEGKPLALNLNPVIPQVCDAFPQ